MVLSSILPVKLGATSRKSRRSLPWVSSSTSLREPQSSSDGLGNLDDCYIRDASTLGDVSGIFDDGDPALQSLNGCLEVLAGIFPDVQLEVFREMLGSFGEESRLAVVTEALLKNKAKFVGGRWRVRRTVHKEVETAAEGDGGREDVKVPVEERFRGDGYRKTVQKVLCREFRGLSRSTVDAVLAEHNYSYTLARPTLLSLSSRSWRSSVSSFFLRRKNSSLSAPDKHPLVVMRPLDGSEDAPILPMLRSTGSKELDRELFDTLIRPLQRQHRLDQESRDRELAEAINAAEAEDAGAFYDCECCFTSMTFEQLSACDGGGHFICFDCIRRTINEAIFGQGWGKNIDVGRSTMVCIAPTMNGLGSCEGSVPQDLVRRALAERGTGEVWKRVEERLASDGMGKSKVPLVRCPFCSYAEVDDIYLPADERTWHVKQNGLLSLSSVLLVVSAAGLMPLLLISLLLAVLTALIKFGKPSVNINGHLQGPFTRLARRRRGLRFTCASPTCQRASCLSCSKEWRDVHICYESERLALRAHVERAMSAAIKRTCPRCCVSFVKSSGCNKLTCVCGYEMCYVCRHEIGPEGYRHFCEHFRPRGQGACEECDKCDLYRSEDEEGVLRKASEAAEKEWRAREEASTSTSVSALEAWRWENRDDFAGPRAPRTSRRASWTLPSWEQIIDWVVERLVELH